MQRCPPKPMTPFDEIVTTQKLQMMKLLLPYFPISFRKTFAFYIKFVELQNTLHHFSHITHYFPSANQVPPSDILEEMRPYMNPKDFNSIESVLSILNIMEMMQAMDTDFMSDLSNFTDTPDIMNMMNFFQTESDNVMSSKKGNEENENK